MAIAFNRYVNIVSAVGAGAAVAQRDLIARLISTNINLPTNTVVEFDNFAEVSDYFGSDTDEARRAAFYFGFVSKVATSPNSISYARWAETGVPALVIGAESTTTLAQFNAVTDGAFTITIDGVVTNVTGVDLSLAGDFAAVATAIGAEVSGSTVAYEAADSRFVLTSTSTGDAPISLDPPGAGTDLLPLLGWADGVRLSDGSAAQTVTEVLAESTELTNNFGSFAFVPTLTQEQVTEAATWNDTNNVLFQYHVPVLPADAATYSAALIGFGGTGLTLQSVGTAAPEYHEMLPMAVLAATNYARRGSVQNYMFQQAPLTPTVTTTAEANLYDPLRVNYYGRTQTAGQNLDFYQRGVLTGVATDPVNMNTFANEQWLKDAEGSALMELLLSVGRVPANSEGRGQVLSVLRGPIDQGLLNGTISVGRTLTDTQRVFVEQQTGDPNAYFQVQTSGYWLDANIVEETIGGVPNFVVQYTLIYTKDDVIRRIDGSHILI